MHPPFAAWAIIQCVLRAEAASIMRGGGADGDAHVVEGPVENYATLQIIGLTGGSMPEEGQKLRRILSSVGPMYTRSTPARPS